MALTRLDNLISSKTGKYLYVSPDDFNASDELNNRGNSPIRPFKSIQRAFLEIARYSYLPGPDNDRFDQFTIMLMPGNHYIDNRPGLVDTNGIPEFGFQQALNEWTDSSNLDISDPNNVLYLFNNTEGGAILPRGSSLVGYDLRRTVVRPLYVPDPADRLEKRSAIFNVTGACYFWQFTIKDGDLEPSSPLYDKNEGVGKVYYQNGYWDQLAIPNYSHHKLTVFEYADKEELGLYYQKVAKAFNQYQPTIDDPGEFSERIQETRIVSPLSDIRSIESIKCTDSSPAGTISVEVTTKVNHGYFKNQFIAIENNGLDDQLNGTFSVDTIDLVDARKFTYEIAGTVAALGTTTSLVSGTTYTSQNGLSANAVVKAEVDSVESASPYVFNCSIRSTWGICGIWANGLKATGFKSMVIAQYTGVSLQKDDRAFIRYDEFTNTFNQASLTDAFATVPYHTKGDAFWKDDWRNFHVRASEDAFIQNVSIFAVGFADHFLMESGGDMSITNSNSNFGNTSLHAIGFKGFAFNQDKGGYITDIIPPQIVPETTGNTKRNAYYTLDVKASNDPNNHTKIYYGDDEGYDPAKRPAASIDGFRIGARSDEKLYVKLTPRAAGQDNIFNATLTPNGFKKFTATADILNPAGLTINHKNLDAADRIEENKNFIAYEAYGYITGKYPAITIKENITIEKCRRDIGYLIDATVQDLRLGGNINTIQAAESYYVGNNLSYILGELTETLEGYNYARDLAIAAMRNFSYLRQGGSTTAGSSIVDIGDTSGIVQGMLIADYDPSQFTDGKLNSGATRPASPVIPDNTYVKSIINASKIEIGQKAVYSEKKLVTDRYGDARDLMLANKNFIAAEAYDRMVLDFPGFTTPTGNPQDCKDDIVDVIEAVAENTAFGGNAETFDAAYLYETGAHVAGEEAETIKAFEYARDMCIQVMRNEDVFIFGTHGLTQSKDTSITYEAPELVKDRNGDARDLILSNKNLIANEAVERMLIEYPGFAVPGGNINCIDDVVDLLEAVADNVAYGGNDKTWDAAYSYVKGAHVAGEEAETNYVFEQAKQMAAQVMRNQRILIVGSHGLTQTYDTTITYDNQNTATDRGGDARDLIIANRSLIAAEAYNRMLSLNPGFVSPSGNAQDCIDDITDFITEVAYNTAYGGNDRTWEMANLYVAGAHVAGEETQTVQCFEFARDLMVEAMRNQKILITGSHGFTQTYDTSITYNSPDPVTDRGGDARNLINANTQFIAEEAYARMLAKHPTFNIPTGNPQDCKDDIADFATEVAYNTAFGGNDRVWDMSNLYVTGAHVVGEETETVEALNFARDIMIQIMRNEDVLVVGSHGLTQTKDLTITVNEGTPVDNKSADARNLILSNKNFIAEIALGRMLDNFSGFNVPTGSNNDCLDDIKDVIDVVAYNLAFGGNERVWDAANLYATGAHVAGEEAQTNYAFEQARDLMIEVMRNETVNAGGYTSAAQVFDTSITVDGSNPTCPQQAATITTLIQILTNTVLNGTTYLYTLPRTFAAGPCEDVRATITTLSGIATSAISTPTSLASVTRTPSAGSCEDVRSTLTTLTTIVVNAVTTPTSLANVAKTASSGSCEDVRTTINTLFGIVQSAVTNPSSLTNIHRTLSNGSCQNVAGAITSLFQIVTDTISNPGYLQSIERTESPLGLAFGPSVNANSTSTNSYLYFTLTSGTYTSEFAPTTDESITQHTTYPECVDQANTIRQYFANISTIIQTGLNTVPRNEPTQLTTQLASRATVWTLVTGSGTNPHQLETGTPVRLVPRPRYDSVTNAYVDIDKRKVRLPNGFETNEKYYVIAPGRTTKPEDYSSAGAFDGTDQTKIMLASSKENAAAGIYIHSAEVEAIDPDIEIDIYNFVLDDNYDLHQYACVLDNAVNSGIRTDVPHIFDVPFADIPGHQVFIRPNEGGSVPLVGAAYAADPTVADANGRLRGDRFFWARYQNEKVFTIHATKADAIADVNPITFQPGAYDFTTFADKREAPVRFDPTFLNPGTTPTIYGKWYMQVENHSENPSDPEYDFSILTRLHENTYSDLSGQDKTNDSWFERIKDERDPDERIYRLRYVIPQYLQAVRDPINGFSIKIRKDETRKLLPQKLVLKPVSGNVTKASFFNPVQANEKIGFTKQDFISGNLNEDLAYDPYRRDIVGTTNYKKVIETENYVSMSIQSGRYFIDANDGNEYLELTVFDQGITNLSLLNESFTTLKITAPQGGNFIADKTQSLNSTNRIEWFGNSSGYAFLHAVMNVPGTSDWYMILKGVSGKINYSEFDNIRFTQGAVFADLLADQDFGKSLYIKDLIAKGYPEYYYRQNGAPVYTITPGDIITDDANIQYYVESVSDTGELDDTFYIFDVEEIQRRIYGQQDGIYYLTAVRGNISPFPTGAGNQGNFRNFKFSQPISKLYPLNYKNDPLWFKQLDNTELDPPATYSAADNYTHGLVRVNDFKGSMTREMALDFTSQAALSNNTYTQVSSTVDNRLRAQKGNASSGSEDRRIPIAGDSTVMSDQRLYVELRRPSIARAGNHTFEYLGFGPGNYSTGLPARQEIVLTPTQDFYAQSKKQDGGLVFYTGLNSNGDLYIGNRKIDAITGEEEFLESAQLVDSDDDTEDIGNLVTTFDTPVTFNEYITVNGGDAQDRMSTFNSPVTINVLGRVREYALNVISNVSPSDGDDGTLDKTQQFLNQDTNGDIIIARNRVAASIFQFNPRGSNGAAQGYKIQNHAVAAIGSNITPNQSPLYGTGLGTALNATQNVSYGGNAPLSGDILLKGAEVGRSGSLGWIYASFYQTIANSNILNVTMDGSTVITINWSNNLSNEQVGVKSGSQIRISNFSDSAFNGLWQIIANGFSNTATSCQIAIIENRGNVANDNPRLWADEVAIGNGVSMEFSNSSWKEVGVLGAEALRTETDNIGDYKLGINTVARSAHDAYQTAFVDGGTDPRANLDVVGNAFISGKKISDYLNHDAFGDRTENAEGNALLVGGDSANPNNEATFRVATTNNGRVGINVTNAELDRVLVVDGESRFTGDARFQEDIEVHGGGGANTAEIRTDITTGTFNLLPDENFTGSLNIAPKVTALRVLDDQTSAQSLRFGGYSTVSDIFFGNTPETETNISRITIGGAYNNNESLSFTQIDNKSLKVSGDFQLGTRRGLLESVKLTSTAGKLEFFSGNSATNKVDFALNASEIVIGGQGGSTRIRNNLIVDSTARFNSDVTLCGGFASYSFTADRAQSGSNRIAHPTGILGNNLFNSNVDIITVARYVDGDSQYNQIDTTGSGNWGGNFYQQAITNIGGNPQVEPQNLPALSGNQYYLPLVREALDDLGNPYFTENDILLIDSPEAPYGYQPIGFATYNTGTTAQGIIAEVSGGVDISASGTGVGSNGGFATGQSYLHFHTATANASFNGPRYATFNAVDGSFYNGLGPITAITLDIYVGNNNNGGELPDALNEGLQVRYSLDNGTTWTSLGFIAPDNLNDSDPSTWPTFEKWLDQSENFARLQIDVPVDAQQANVQFQLWQEVISGTPYDNYGITTLSYTVPATSFVEFVRVVSTPRIATAPYYIVVEREPFGTFTGISNNHPDRTSIFKCNVQFDATWLEQPIDDVGDSENVYLAQFGGSINTADYVIVSRESSYDNDVFDIGEVFKVDTLLDLVAKKFRIKNGCDTNDEETVFEIDSTTGDTIINSETTVINGNLNLNGTCTTPFVNSDTNKKLTITNGALNPITTFEVDTCTGDTQIGNVHGTVIFLANQFGTTGSAYVKDADLCTVYRFDPQTELTTGPITTLAVAIAPVTSDIEITSNIDAFSAGDYVAIYVTDAQIEIIQVTADPFTLNGLTYLPTSSNVNYPTGGRGVEGTTAQSFQAGTNVVKLEKYERTTTLLHDLPASVNDRANLYQARTPNTNVLRLELTLRDADLISPKLDYFTMMRIGTEFFVADSIDGSLDAFYAIKMPKQVRNPNTASTTPVYLYGGGKTTIHDDVEIYSGALRMYGSDGKTLVMSIANDDGHSGDGSIEDPKTNTNGLTIKGGVTAYGDIKVYYDDCQMNGICSTETSFRVTNKEGNVEMGERFYQKGFVREEESGTEVMFHIDNLGPAGVGGTEGAKDFRIYHNNAIDSFGIEKYWTRNGGRRQTYVAFDPGTGIGQQQDNPLEANNNYIINTSSGSNMVLYLPDNPETGDMIRFIELAGNLTYNTSLVIRALKIANNATPIQGDSTGSRIGAGAGQTLTTAWDSGELVIQSRNAAFGLLYVGVVDIEGSSNAQTIPPSLRGWWLMEL